MLVFDNFEDNLTRDGGAFRDPVRGAALQALIDVATVGKLLLTSRYPPPGIAGAYELAVGPLSAGELLERGQPQPHPARARSPGA